MIKIPTKRCGVCGRKKALVLFNLDPTASDGRDSRCKTCYAQIRRGQRAFRTQAQVVAAIQGRINQ